MINGHGNDIYSCQVKVKADFSSNVLQCGINNELIKHLKSSVFKALNYPEPGAVSLQNAIALHIGVPSGMIMVTNGSTEAFYLLAQITRGLKSTIVIPSFSEYEDAARCNSHRLKFIKFDKIEAGAKLNSDCLWIGNPNNPDGNVIPAGELLSLCENNPETMVIVDEAYSHACSSKPNLLYSKVYPRNLVIVRSFTKEFAIPGLRLGYIVGDEKLLARIWSCKAPWSVNSLAIEAGLFIIRHWAQLKPDVEPVLSESLRLQHALGNIKGIEVKYSPTNFFLANTHRGAASDLKNYLLANHGFLIRDASNFRGLSNGFFRVAANKPALNDKLVKAIDRWMVGL